ncbi:uncharacterized protein MONBRDRAFT_37050 [Monosiga brevicollis MX1]|uniref:G domain-containing protein n=1 Tax=Monosiga brevicollis TaxID=81824 RepID=A9UZA3_MONBE|nr:uncharacterized protein MONBRDRAFT_37050 [Monosiga brevicollis MX1]EDQ89333.1 predicted protein [Monosiga brevicollis MX1]|eukprot:XP_001745909.1 hypothetical protein [Monosiga brevicollis MX1]
MADASSAEVRDKLLGNVLGFSHNVTSIIPLVNVLLAGAAGSGKSALLNTLHTIFMVRGHLSDIVEQGQAATDGQMTNRLFKTQFKLNQSDVARLAEERGVRLDDRAAHIMPWSLWDTMGFHDANLDSINLRAMLSGRMLSGHPLTQGGDNEDKHFLRDNPGPQHAVHCVIATVAAPQAKDPVVQQNIIQLRRRLHERRTPYLVALTKIDLLGADVKVADVVRELAHDVGIRACNIYPVELYGENPDVVVGDPKIETPVLRLLWAALCAAEDRLRHSQAAEPVSFDAAVGVAADCPKYPGSPM